MKFRPMQYKTENLQTPASVLEVEMLLWYHYSQAPFPNIDSSPAQEALNKLCALKIVEKKTDNSITVNEEAIKTYVEAVLKVPFPKRVWTVEHRNTDTQKFEWGRPSLAKIPK